MSTIFQKTIRAFAVKDVVLTSLELTEGLVWEGEITPELMHELLENLISGAIDRYIYFDGALTSD